MTMKIKFNVWAGIPENTLIIPLIIEGNFTGDLYIRIVEGTIDPFVTVTQIDTASNLVIYSGGTRNWKICLFAFAFIYGRT